MSEDQKLDLIWVVKTWGLVITALLGTLISLIVWIYLDGKAIQNRINDDTSQFIKGQRISNTVIFDMIVHYHPDANDKIIQTFSKYELMNTRSVK